MYVAGVDLGSLTVKAVIISDQAEVIGYGVDRAGISPDSNTEKLLNKILEKYQLSWQDLSYIVGTGYGRNMATFANKRYTEILCHAKGAQWLHPATRTVIDIGGQDSKGMKLTDSGAVAMFAMNDRCAAGTGRFLEVMEGALGLPFERWQAMIRSATNHAEISSICTVFAETEIISKVTQKIPLEEIVAGICDSISKRVVQMVRSKLGTIQKDVFFSGGVALNRAVVDALSEHLGVEVCVPDNPQIVGALGAALLAGEQKCQ